MDHQLLREMHQSYAQGWDLLIDPAESFEKMKLEKGSRSYYQDDHPVRYKDERSFGHVKGVDCPDQRKQYLPRLKRVQRNSTSGMQAVLLSGCHPRSHSSSGSAGTGVFLPAGTANAVEPTRKPGCSTVLLPTGVIQALKLHFDRMERQAHYHPQQCSCCCSFPPWKDAMANYGDRSGNTGQGRRFQMETAGWKQGMDEGLLQEWIYRWKQQENSKIEGQTEFSNWRPCKQMM